MGTNADAVVLTKEINMKIKTQIITIAILTVVLIGIAVYVDGPDRGSRGGKEKSFHIQSNIEVEDVTTVQEAEKILNSLSKKNSIQKKWS